MRPGPRRCIGPPRSSFRDAMRFANMMVGSPDPIQVDVGRWEAVMKRYVINGTPVVGDGEADRAAIARNTKRLTAVDKPGSSADDWDSAETRAAHPHPHRRLTRGDRRQHGTRMAPTLIARAC